MLQNKALSAALVAAIVLGSFPAAAQRNRVDNRARANDGAFMGGGMAVPESVVVTTPAPARPRMEAAPVPNAGIQAPREAPRADVAQVQPTFISPRLPGRGHAQETGSPGELQDRLFRPAPGAQVRIPVIW